MSAIKTHEVFNIVSGDDITLQNEDGDDQILKVKSIMVDRQRASVAQIFAQQENTGSMARETKCYHAKIKSIVPGSISTDFLVKARVNNEFMDLNLTTVKSESSECIIC